MDRPTAVYKIEYWFSGSEDRQTCADEYDHVYLDREDAQAEADRLNRASNDERRAKAVTYTATAHRRWVRDKQEYEALVRAGLREGQFLGEEPVLTFKETVQYLVEEIEVK